jgi:hypothetical protein
MMRRSGTGLSLLFYFFRSIAVCDAASVFTKIGPLGVIFMLRISADSLTIVGFEEMFSALSSFIK